MKNNFSFKLWVNPHYWFALGYVTEQQIHLTWIEKLGPCSWVGTNMKDMFYAAARNQGLDHDGNCVGIGMTIIDEDFYQEEYRIKYERFKRDREQETE